MKPEGKRPGYCAGKIRLVIVVTLLVLSARPAYAGTEEFNHLYGAFLSEYWHANTTIHGIQTSAFDYAAMANDAKKNNSLYSRIIKSLLTVDSDMDVDEMSKAFWLNVYNFTAMKLVIENYPVKSIRDIKISLFRYPWSKKAIQVGNQTYSLSWIEKEILLKQYHDPRIVFAVSCAAISCPDRIPVPFRADHLDSQLDNIIRHFFSNPDKGLLVDNKNGILKLTSILKKDRHLFGDSDRDLKTFVCGYVEKAVCDWLRQDGIDIDFFEHDWTLNDIALSDM